ncbi:MAG: BlaI family transcriptional regulator, penicillinase repressor [Eubacteriaceae bacterium]|jgi:predicted transcriptional regulator|nr:BlaI family transcriptional regulator, penicillinase repressor [Eubacteriaceae bacterium]MDK2905230.1 BlaI family transcriptional regulator, penicillinase repressor [Eubacteriaceae bacterium]MDK2935248.1 BlaI family transcriptional regulator, penicillinase repressor [Eubacteriaceae bacterium]MDN5308429.1 BlaI family transcriptional regulator, penicillinase repressor [Eubacteriaceae bacterium]
MEKYKLGEMEQKFADLIWENAPIPMRDLIILCAQAFDWKRTTTYTMFKRLSSRGLFLNDNGSVKITLSKEDFLTQKGEEFLEETFNGSLPGFITAFTRQRKLSDQEVDEIQRLINAYKEEVT